MAHIGQKFALGVIGGFGRDFRALQFFRRPSHRLGGAVAAVVVGLYAGSRQFWFIGTNDRGVLALYQGLPYNLPFGIHLYTKGYASSVPAVPTIANGRVKPEVT